ncbi:MAG: HEAT repeat domain-containing protein [Pirellulales bacterium]|nr:HEAT repeat domain-containing protein [Pirellulales bacterium]
MRITRSTLPLLMFCFVAPLRVLAGAPGQLELKPGDHVAIIGNTLAERLQHDGWFEARLHARYPQHQLSIRNLGFSGDELKLRLRSQDFGSPDDWLTRVAADVVLAMFGHGESYAGEAGLAAFKADLAEFITHTLGQKYNGRTAPRLAIIGPLAFEKLGDINLPDGAADNERRILYTAAMAEVCQAHNVPFVDLFALSRAAYEAELRPLTINGVHLTEYGNQVISRAIAKELFGDPEGAAADDAKLEPLRQAVADKSFVWFERYRTVDGYSIYGGRADLKFVAGQTNRVVMQREMEVLDAMTANRDARIWALARGENPPPVDDSNTPEFIPVVTNKPGRLPGGKHEFLDGDAAIEKMTVADGMKVNLFASEKQFPELVNPVQMSWDTAGRLWVAVWPTYPHWKPKEAMCDKLLVLEDSDGDGRADRCTHFADDLNCPTGFEFYNGGVLVAQAPYLMFLKDTDGDGRADYRQRLVSSLDSADTHHAANSFVLDPGGAVYFQEGTFHHTQVETPWGPNVRLANAGVFRYEPRAQKFEVYVTHGFANPHGHVFDRWGQDIVVDGTGSNPYHAALFSGRLAFPEKHPSPPQVYQQRTRPCPGMEYLSSRHFPDAMQGRLLVGNVIGFQGILQYEVFDEGASFGAKEVEPLLSSSDQNFRPSDIKIGPDGAIYFLDWHNPIIGHMQHNLRDPSRDREHGRVYRVTCEGRPLSPPTIIAGEPIPALLELLKSREERVRYRARIELASREIGPVLADANAWIAGLDQSAPEREHHLLDALWLMQSFNVVNVDLLKRVLASPDFRARAAATRVLCYQRDRVSDALEMLKSLAADAHPRVRLEAVRAASFFPLAEAIEVPLVASEHPSDRFLAYVSGETMKALAPHVRDAIAARRPIRFTTPAGARYFLKNVSNDDLVKLDPTPQVWREMLSRAGIRDEERRRALQSLADDRKVAPSALLLEIIADLDAAQSLADESVLFDLVRLLTDLPAGDLSVARDRIEQLTTEGKRPVTRQLAFVALVAADGGADRVWESASTKASALTDLVSAVPLIRDPSGRAALYQRLESLVAGLPPQLAPSATTDQEMLGRFVRVDLLGRQRTLTLAEVEVYSEGRNVALDGRASQSDTAHGGDAARGIDGNRSGEYSAGGQTHTSENAHNPWWEVDLGSALPIDKVVVFNRTDDSLGTRLEGFVLKVLDADRKTIFESGKLSAPTPQTEIAVGGTSVERTIRRGAMLALASIRGQEGPAFRAIAPRLTDERDRPAALAALLRIPPQHWPKDDAPALADQVLAYLGSLPVEARTSPAALDAVQVGDQLAALLPTDQAASLRRKLGELGVRVLRLGTVTDQMRYDQEQLVVAAGRPIEILLENTDLMPHNLVIAQPGSMEEIGNLAEAAATDPGAVARNYVPSSDKILLASRLLRPRESQRLRWTAPTEPGVYPYVCTYPGHWRRMFGSLYVVENLDDYLAAPEKYVAEHRLAPRDELLKFNRPRTVWTVDDLSESIAHLAERSFAGGKRMFEVASCVACHKLNGSGQEFGPDLAKLDAKLTPADILRAVIEPSHKIDDKYTMYTFELDSGQTLTAMIVKETAGTLEVIENPLAKVQPVVLNKQEIVAREKSAASIMPKGLLDKLTHEEILDLLSYVIARGAAEHTVFQGGGHDHGGH